MASSILVPVQVQARTSAPAQENSGPDMQEIMAELQRLRDQVSVLSAKVESLEAEKVAGSGPVAVSPAPATAPAVAGIAAVAVSAVAKEPDTKISWKGAPLIESKSGWSFKPRGRIQFDAGAISVPSSTGVQDGFGSEVRRIYLGVEGDMPGGFGYRLESDFAGNNVDITDAYLTYTDRGLELTIGQHNNFQSLEEMSSDRFASFMERAAFTDAFGFERRLGASVQYSTGPVLVQGGVFSDNIASLPGKSWSADGRIVYMPKLGDTQLHFGGSAHYTDLSQDNNSVRYRQRPLVHFTSDRFINTGSFNGSSETGTGLELAVIHGPLHVTGEGFWQHVSRSGAAENPTFFGGYAEMGLFLTKGDTRGYKRGVFERTKPANPVGKGGFGAVQAVFRYDYLDLNDAQIVGGKQDAFEASLIWAPTAYTRFMLNYALMKYSDAVYPAAGGDTSYGVDVFGMRAQIDF